jgi:hypothetical protein
MGLVACGGASGDAVVRVGESSISKATVDHWTRVEGVLSYQVIPRQPVPNGVVPDPPNYTACIAHLEATAQPAKGQPKSTTAQLRDRCQQWHTALRRKMLDMLITFNWLNNELISRGGKVTDGEVKQAFEEFRHHEFSTEEDFHKYLTYTGMSVSDVLFLMKDTILGTKIQQKIVANKGLTPQQQEQVFVNFYNELKKKWTARTNCHPEYVVPGCKQYTGSESPI